MDKVAVAPSSRLDQTMREARRTGRVNLKSPYITIFKFTPRISRSHIHEGQQRVISSAEKAPRALSESKRTFNFSPRPHARLLVIYHHSSGNIPMGRLIKRD